MIRNHFAIDKDLFVCLCYIVPSYSSPNADIDSNVYDTILDELVKLCTNYIENNTCFMLIGDLNSRVGEMPDFVHNDNDFLVNQIFLPDDHELDVPLQRTTQDHNSSSNGLL